MTGLSLTGPGRAPDVDLTLPAKAGSVTIARQLVYGLGDAIGWGDERNAQVALAVSEACTNAVVHGGPDAPGGLLTIRAWLQDERMLIAVRDQGAGVTPRIPSEGGGLGLGVPLMLALSEEVTFRRDGDWGEVLMSFRLTDADAEERR